MNRYISLFRAGAPPMPKSLPIHLAILLSPDFPELKNINRLLLIPSCLARATAISGAFTKTPEISAVCSTWRENSTAKSGRSKYATSPRFSRA
jgi:hypothetical protein